MIKYAVIFSVVALTHVFIGSDLGSRRTGHTFKRQDHLVYQDLNWQRPAEQRRAS